MKIKRFFDQPGWLKSIVLGAGICILIGLLYFLDLRPTFTKIEQDKNRIATLTTENDAFRKEILRFKKPTQEEIRAWEKLSVFLKERIPQKKETLLAARLLAERAAENQLMDVTIKVPTLSASAPTLTQIAGELPPSKTKKNPFKQLKIQSFDMEIDFVSSLQKSLSFLDEIGTNPVRYLELIKIKMTKDFPFIRTNAIIRFYYGGRLDVKE